MRRSNFCGGQAKRHAGISESVQLAPQFGHPRPPAVKRVLDNEPVRANASELFEPAKPWRLPAGEMSWQGKPADTIKPSFDDANAEGVDLAESDGLPSDVLGGDCKAADAAKEVKMFHSAPPRISDTIGRGAGNCSRSWILGATDAGRANIAT